MAEAADAASFRALFIIERIYVDYIVSETPHHYTLSDPTVAGFVVAELGRLAEEGDTVALEKGVLKVERVEDRRVEQLVLEREPKKAKAE